MSRILAMLLGPLLCGACAAQLAPASISQILPSIAQLGPGWLTNRVTVLVDPLSVPKEQVDPRDAVGGTSNLLQNVREMIRTSGREAHALAKYSATNGQYVVFINRFKSRQAMGDDWGRDKETRISPGALPKVGEEVRFDQRHGIHDDLTFRRGNYLVCVECASGTGMDNLKRLAEALDRNLVEAQKAGRR